MRSYWSRVEPFWKDLPTDDASAFLAFYESIPLVSRHLITTHWVFSEVCNGGFRQLFTNWTGILVPESMSGYRAMGLVELADIVREASSFFGPYYPREQMARIEALDRYAPSAGDLDDCNPFQELDDRFYDALDLARDEDGYTSRANAYAAGI